MLETLTRWLAANYTFILVATAWFTAGMGFSAAWRWRRMSKAALDQTATALEALAALERSHDPGRDVHERLAAAIEPGLIRDHDHPFQGDASLHRRTVAMALAGSMIDTIQRANLDLVAKTDE